jgi:hypothetical protein
MGFGWQVQFVEQLFPKVARQLALFRNLLHRRLGHRRSTCGCLIRRAFSAAGELLFLEPS